MKREEILKAIESYNDGNNDFFFIEMNKQVKDSLVRLIEHILQASGVPSTNEPCDLAGVVGRSEQFSLADMKEAYNAGENNAGSYTYPPFEEWFSKR